SRDARIECEQPLGARRPAVRRRLDELARGGVEVERSLLDVLEQRVPGREAMLARDHRLRVVERERSSGEVVVARVLMRGKRAEARQRGGVSGARGAQQLFRLTSQLF